VELPPGQPLGVPALLHQLRLVGARDLGHGRALLSRATSKNDAAPPQRAERRSAVPPLFRPVRIRPIDSLRCHGRSRGPTPPDSDLRARRSGATFDPASRGARTRPSPRFRTTDLLLPVLAPPRGRGADMFRVL
jgi:hypothetical protein